MPERLKLAHPGPLPRLASSLPRPTGLALPDEKTWCRGITVITAALGIAVLASVGTLARAQTAVVAPAPMEAKAQYDLAVAGCNAGGLNAGQRGECLSVAQSNYMLARGGQAPASSTSTSTDGRATIVSPTAVPVFPAKPLSPDDVTAGTPSNDGRATIIPPTVISQ